MDKEITVSGIVFSGNKILLIKHKKLDTWLYPGGHLEKNEEPAEALKREVKEEVGLDIHMLPGNKASDINKQVRELPRPFKILRERIDGSRGEPHYHIDMIYLCSATTEATDIEIEEIDEARWVRIDDIKKLDTPPELQSILIEADRRVK